MTSLCLATVLLCSLGDFLDQPIFVLKPVHIVGGYSLGRPPGGDLQLYEPGASAIIEQSVIRIGWDEEFILVEQYPLERPIVGVPDAHNPSWHIIVVSTGEHFTWQTYDDFMYFRDVVLQVPDTIEMRNARDVYYDR